MVDLANFQQINVLANEQSNITAALERFGQGWRIVGLELGPPDAPMPGMPGMPGMPVPTRGMEYPPQMVTTIKAALQARLEAVTKTLAELGVTGTIQAARAPQPGPQGPQAPLQKGKP